MQIIDKIPGKYKLTEYLTYRDTAWNKASRDGDNYILMGTPTTCKDYIIDQTCNPDVQKTLNVKEWSHEQLHSSCYYIYIQSSAYYKNFANQIKAFLNVYEDKHGFSPTKVTPFTIDRNHFYIVEGDEKWNTTAAGRSYYLSLVRSCLGMTTPTDDTFEKFYASLSENIGNEYYYFYQLPKVQEYFFNNPQELLVISDKCTYTGFPTGYLCSHGQSGLFWHIDYIYEGLSRITKFNPHLKNLIKKYNV